MVRLSIVPRIVLLAILMAATIGVFLEAMIQQAAGFSYVWILMFTFLLSVAETFVRIRKVKQQKQEIIDRLDGVDSGATGAVRPGYNASRAVETAAGQGV